MNQPIYSNSHSMQTPLELTLIDGQMKFTKLLIGAGVDVTSGDWNAILGRYLASRVMSLEFCEEFLVLWMQAGGTINVDIIIRHNEIMDLSQ